MALLILLTLIVLSSTMIATDNGQLMCYSCFGHTDCHHRRIVIECAPFDNEQCYTLIRANDAIRNMHLIDLSIHSISATRMGCARTCRDVMMQADDESMNCLLCSTNRCNARDGDRTGLNELNMSRSRAYFSIYR